MENFDVHNRFSAVSSVLFSLAELLENGGFEVWVNSVPMATEMKASNTMQQAGNGPMVNRGRLARFIPKRVKATIKQWLNFKRLSNFRDNLVSIPKPDLIIEFQSHGSKVGAELSQSWQVPLLYIYDAPQIEEYRFLHGHAPPLSRMVEQAELTSLHAASKIMAYSPAVAQEISKKIALDKSFFYHQLADFKRFTPMPIRDPEGKITIGYIGSFLKWHNLEILLRVFERIRMEGYEANLSLIGTGMEYNSICELASKLQSSDEIKFHGYADGDKLLELIQEMHIGVIPNAMWFHGPVKLFQYGASGLLTLAANTPTIRFIADLNPGITLFESNSEEDLYQKLKHLLDNRSELKERSQKNMDNTLKLYGPERVLNLFKKEINSLIDSNA